MKTFMVNVPTGRGHLADVVVKAEKLSIDSGILLFTDGDDLVAAVASGRWEHVKEEQQQEQEK